MKKQISMLLACSIICTTLVAMQEYELLPTEEPSIQTDTLQIHTPAQLAIQQHIDNLRSKKRSHDALYGSMVLGLTALNLYNVACEEKSLESKDYFGADVLGVCNKINAAAAVGLAVADLAWLLKPLFNSSQDTSSEETWDNAMLGAHFFLGCSRTFLAGAVGTFGGIRRYPQTLAMLTVNALCDLIGFHNSLNHKKIAEEIEARNKQLTSDNLQNLQKITDTSLTKKSDAEQTEKQKKSEIIRGYIKRKRAMNVAILLARGLIIGGNFFNSYFDEKNLFKQHGNNGSPCECPRGLTSCPPDGAPIQSNAMYNYCQQTIGSNALYAINDGLTMCSIFSGYKEMYDLVTMDENNLTQKTKEMSSIWRNIRGSNAGIMGTIATIAGVVNGLKEYPRTIAVWGLNAALDAVSALNWHHTMNLCDEVMTYEQEVIKGYENLISEDDDSSDENI